MSNSRRASRPATRKKNAISPEFTQPCQLSARPLLPDRIASTVCHVAAYPDGSMLAQARAATVAASSTAALPVSVRTNRRSGVCRFRVHTVRRENWGTETPGSVTPGLSRPGQPSHLEQRLEELAGVALFGRGDLFGRSRGHDGTTAGTAFGSQVDHPVRGLDHVEVVLDHDHRVAAVHQPAQDAEQLADVLEV